MLDVQYFDVLEFVKIKSIKNIHEVVGVDLIVDKLEDLFHFCPVGGVTVNE